MLLDRLRSRPRRLLLGLALLVAAASPLAAQQAETTLEGVIFDAAGTPVPLCRVIARDATGTTVYVSPPSDPDGRYVVEVPLGGSYVIVALVSPTGGRSAMPEGEPLVASGPVTFDINLPMEMGPTPRKGATDGGGADRLFLSFVEDPALPRRMHLEGQIDAADFDKGDLNAVRGIFAFQFESLPQLEFGARGAIANIDFGSSADGTGLTDLDVWAKLHFLRSGTTRFDMAFGALLTLPTGDTDSGLGTDALQSKGFVTGSYAFRSAALIAQVGLRASENGEVLGKRLDGEISASAGVGVVWPVRPEMSLIFEANYDGKHFEQTDSETNLLFGINWQVMTYGRVRAALSTGFGDQAADIRVIAGYAFTY